MNIQSIIYISIYVHGKCIKKYDDLLDSQTIIDLMTY